MSANKNIVNTFDGGMDWDSDPTAIHPSTYRYALNLVTTDLYQDTFASNEHSNRLFVDLGSTITGKLYIQSKDSTLYFLDSGEIYLVSHKDASKTFVCSDKEFGCDWHLGECEWIEAIFKYQYSCNELLVYWSSGCEYRWINVDEMLNPKRKAALKSSIEAGENCKSDPNCNEGCGDRTCEYFKVFKGVKAPRVTAHGYENGGTQALAGTYEFITRYKDDDNNTTNWFYFTNPVNLGSPHNMGGEKSYGHIELKISDLDCSYNKLEIVMLRTMDSVVEGESFDVNYSNSSLSFNYVGQHGTPIAIDEVLQRRKKTYLRGRSLFQHGGRLFPYRLKHERNLDWQSKVNNIKIECIAYETTLEFAQKNNLKSFVHGESYGFGIGINWLDYTKSNVFNIPNAGGGGSTSASTDSNTTNKSQKPSSTKSEEEIGGLESRASNNVHQGGNSTDDQATLPTVTYTPKKYNRIRTDIPNNCGNTNCDATYNQSLEDAVAAINADLNRLCANNLSQTCQDCSDGVCDDNRAQVDKALKDWENMLAGFTEDKINIKQPISYSPASIKAAADQLIDAVKQRERITEEKPTVTIDSTTINPGEQSLEARGNTSGNIYDGNGALLSNEQIKILGTFSLAVKEEQNITYPFTKNCNGDNIYGSLAGQKVKHFRFPSEAQVAHYRSGSRGVPSEKTPDGDEYKDIYVTLLGIRVSNIVLPEPEECPKEINKTNPYTIYMLERTDANKTVLAKGLAIRTYVSSNKGNNYVYSRHAVNSFETVERTIDVGGSRRATSPTPHSSFLFFSPDTMFRQQAMNATGIVDLGEVSGIGYRHNLYAEGVPPSDQTYGTRVDQRGTCQAVNLSVFNRGSGSYTSPRPCTGTIYVQADSVCPSPASQMSAYSLMNKYKESTLWVGGELPPLRLGVTGDADASFVGDTLDHQAPIHNASGNYVALVRNLPDQYGSLVNASYIPILQAGSGKSTSIEGVCGDAYTNPITIKRSGYVSEKVGNTFPIGGGSSTDGRPSNKKEDRSVKDSPEDVVRPYFGMWVQTTLPKSGDVADAKNWAGLHTTGTVDDWNTAKGKTAPDSDYYYPRVVKTLVSFTCQSSVDTNKRVISDIFHEKFYPKLGQYYICSHAPDRHDWTKSFLNLFGFDVNQPSTWKKTAKTLVRTILGGVLPMLQLENAVNIEGFTDMAAYFASFPLLGAMWHLMNNVLFTNDWLDNLFGIPQVKTDDEGGEDDSNLHGFHDHFSEYNWSYSKGNNYSIDRGLPDPYYTCACDDCMAGETTNEIYFSNKQILTSSIDSYRSFNSLDYLQIPAHTGRLYRLFSNNNKLYAHTEDKLFVIHERNIEPNSFQSGLYLEPYEIGENIPEGLYGNIDPKASIQTQYGYFFIDRQARKVYQFDNQIVEISSHKMFNFFKDYLNFCSTSDCIDEKGGGIYYSMGVDPRLQRLLLTKNDPSGSWTISYSLTKKKWISFHSYIPTDYVWDRDDLYSIKGSQVWIHKNNDEGEQGDNTECSFQSFFGKSYPYMVDITVRDTIDNYLAAFELSSLILDTQACNCENNSLTMFSRKQTFDQIGIRNSYQTAGLNEIILRDAENIREGLVENYGKLPTSFQHNQYRLNGFKDVTNDYCAPLISLDKCHPEPKYTNFDFSKSRNTPLQDTYFNIRLILNRNNIKLYTRYLLSNIQKMVR